MIFYKNYAREKNFYAKKNNFKKLALSKNILL